ncbi:MAG TPA: hypothetical protein VIG07_00500 [Methylomirabilota bacterium]
MGRLMAVAVVVLGVTGCASQLKPYADPEQARIDEYERAAEQILRSRGIDGPPPVVRIGSDPALVNAGRPAAYYTPRTGLGDLGRPGRILINRAAIADDYIAQAVLSQELAHFVLGHADGRCRDRRHECEVEASITSVELLMTGWDLSYADAVRLQYAYLKSVVLAVQRGDTTTVAGDRDPCRQLQEFAARFKASATCE